MKIIRFILLALCCWIGIGLFVWQRPLPSATSLVGARGRGVSTTVVISDQDGSISALKRKLLEAVIWQPLPKDKTASVVEADFVGPPKPVFWSHVATVSTVSLRYVVLRSDTGEVKVVQEGSSLPDGSKLVTVASDHVEVVSRPVGRQPTMKAKGRSSSEKSLVIKTYLN